MPTDVGAVSLLDGKKGSKGGKGKRGKDKNFSQWMYHTEAKEKFDGNCKQCGKYGHKAKVSWQNRSNKDAKGGKADSGKATAKGKRGNGKGKCDGGKKGGKPTTRDGGCFTCGAQGHMAKDCPWRVLVVTAEVGRRGRRCKWCIRRS